MTTLYMRSYTVERNFHPTDRGYRYAADFEVVFGGTAYAAIVFTLLWNAEKRLVPGTTHTETVITDASSSISKSGAGWAVVADIAGEEHWVSHKNTIIRFRRRFTVELPIAPAISKVPVLGEMAKELGATTMTRIQVEGYFDVISYISNMESTIY